MTSLELFEVEMRPVARSGDKAWVFNKGSGWGEAPGLVRKASLEGFRLAPAAFAAEFPEADLLKLPLNGETAKARS